MGEAGRSRVQAAQPTPAPPPPGIGLTAPSVHTEIPPLWCCPSLQRTVMPGQLPTPQGQERTDSRLAWVDPLGHSLLELPLPSCSGPGWRWGALCSPQAASITGTQATWGPEQPWPWCVAAGLFRRLGRERGRRGGGLERSALEGSFAQTLIRRPCKTHRRLRAAGLPGWLPSVPAHEVAPGHWPCSPNPGIASPPASQGPLTHQAPPRSLG